MLAFHEQMQHPTREDLAHRRWIYVPYDRYTDRVGPLAEQPAADTGIVIVESTAKAFRRPYHKKKLVALISNMRHFALEQQARGVAVLYHFSPVSHGQALLALQQNGGPRQLACTVPAERELRLDLADAQKSGLAMQQVVDPTWVSTRADFIGVYGAFETGKSYLMDRFYRRMRQQTGILMQRGKPVGGEFSFDAENRKPYKNEVPVPAFPLFAPDAITQEVITMVDATYAHHFGTTARFDVPCTQADCDAMWQFFLDHLLPHFGRFEDAMRDDHPHLFHSKTSVLLNLGRLLARDLIADVAERADNGTAPLAACEGFIRQLLGWREFMRHIHEQTDGYRLIANSVPQEQRPRPQIKSPDQPSDSPPSYEAAPPGPGAPRLDSETWDSTNERVLGSTDIQGGPSFAASSQRVGSHNASASHAAVSTPRVKPLVPAHDPYAGATPSALGAALPLPAVYWGVKSGMHCIDTVVAQVVDEGWSHHITRLMVLSNLAVLCGFSPRELTDWFWFAYVDAYDWVVEPNVLGMATYADGGLTATKPYVSGAAYINRMSNFCGHCQYDPKKSIGPGSCPFTALYWTFLDTHRDLLAKNFRMKGPYAGLRQKSAEELVQLRARADEAIAHLRSFDRPGYEEQL